MKGRLLIILAHDAATNVQRVEFQVQWILVPGFWHDMPEFGKNELFILSFVRQGRKEDGKYSCLYTQVITTIFDH